MARSASKERTESKHNIPSGAEAIQMFLWPSWKVSWKFAFISSFEAQIFHSSEPVKRQLQYEAFCTTLSYVMFNLTLTSDKKLAKTQDRQTLQNADEKHYCHSCIA